MTLEFFLVLVAVVGFGLVAMWIYAAIFDLFDAWKKKRDMAMLREGRLPPMAPTGLYDYDAPIGPPDGHERRPKLPKARRMMD